MIQDYFNIAVKNLRKRKLRSALTILGIFIAIATIFILISISLGLQGAVEEQFRLLGTDKFFVQPSALFIAGPGAAEDSSNFTIKDAEVMEKVSGVKEVTYMKFGNAEIDFKEEKRFFQVVGVPLDSIDLLYETGAYETESGRLLEKSDSKEVILGNQYKNNNLFGRPIDAGEKITINGVEFKVKGILKSLGNPSDDRLAIISYSDFREVFKSDDLVDQIIVQVESGQDVKEVAAKAEKNLMRARGVKEKTKDFTVLTPEELLESFGTILNIITGFLLAVGGISLIVGAIGIANTMYTSVLERTREIGTMKAVGAKNSDILLIFLIEAGLLGLIGGLIGILFGYSISKTIEYIAVNQLGTNLLQAATPFYLIFGCLVFAFLIGAASGVLPAVQASKLKPVDALRYE